MSFTRTRKKKTTWPEAAVLVNVAVVVIAVIWVINTLIVQLAWNLGVVNGAKVFHTSVDQIGFWTAFGIAFVLTLISRVFKRGAPVTTEKS